MKSSRAVLTAVVVVIVLAAVWFVFRRGGGERVDLMTLFDQADKRGQFTVVDASLAGESRKAIAAPANGRITFHVKVPDDGWLKVWLGLKPEAWTVEGNGVHFYAGVSDGRAYETLFTQTINPFANTAERKWIPVTVDLSAYAGEEVNVILNTLSSQPPAPPDDRGDMPLWGSPEIVRR